jgi:hypothetical protein
MPVDTRTVFVVLLFARKPKYSTCGRNANLPPLSRPSAETPAGAECKPVFNNLQTCALKWRAGEA